MFRVVSRELRVTVLTNRVLPVGLVDRSCFSLFCLFEQELLKHRPVDSDHRSDDSCLTSWSPAFDPFKKRHALGMEDLSEQELVSVHLPGCRSGAKNRRNAYPKSELARMTHRSFSPFTPKFPSIRSGPSSHCLRNGPSSHGFEKISKVRL